MPIYDKMHYTKIEERDNNEYSQEISKERNFEIEESDKPCDKVNGKWTWRMKLVAFATLMMYFNIFAGLGIITPYFPTVAAERGINKAVAGFVFSFYPLAGTVASLIVPSLFPVFGPKTLLSGCLVLAGVAQIAFGFGIKLPTNTSFIVFSIMCRLLISAGASSCYTTVVTIAAQEFPSDYAFVIGMGEMFAGLGSFISPAVGGAIYQSGGYLWPTIAMGLSMLATAQLILVIFKDIKFETHKPETGLFRHAIKIMKLPGILIGVEITFVASLFRSVLDPIFAIFGNEVLNLDARGIGLLYMVVWLTYFIFSAPVGRLADRSEKHFAMLCIGFAIFVVGFLLLGPTPLFTFLPVGTIWLAVIANIILGLGYGFAFVPAIPYLMHLTRNGDMDIDIMTSGVLSAVSTSVISFGEFVGPTVATVIAVDIRWDLSIIGFVALAQTVLLVMYAFCRCICSSNAEAEEKQRLSTQKH